SAVRAWSSSGLAEVTRPVAPSTESLTRTFSPSRPPCRPRHALACGLTLAIALRICDELGEAGRPLVEPSAAASEPPLRLPVLHLLGSITHSTGSTPPSLGSFFADLVLGSTFGSAFGSVLARERGVRERWA